MSERYFDSETELGFRGKPGQSLNDSFSIELLSYSVEPVSGIA